MVPSRGTCVQCKNVLEISEPGDATWFASAFAFRPLIVSLCLKYSNVPRLVTAHERICTIYMTIYTMPTPMQACSKHASKTRPICEVDAQESIVLAMHAPLCSKF